MLIALGRSGVYKCSVRLLYLCFLSKTNRYDFVTGVIFLQYSDFYSQIDCADNKLFWNNLFYNFYSGQLVSADKFLQCYQGKQAWANRVHTEDLLLPLKIIAWELTLVKTANNIHASIMLKMLH